MQVVFQGSKCKVISYVWRYKSGCAGSHPISPILGTAKFLSRDMGVSVCRRATKISRLVRKRWFRCLLARSYIDPKSSRSSLRSAWSIIRLLHVGEICRKVLTKRNWVLCLSVPWGQDLAGCSHIWPALEWVESQASWGVWQGAWPQQWCQSNLLP